MNSPICEYNHPDARLALDLTIFFFAAGLLFSALEHIVADDPGISMVGKTYIVLFLTLGAFRYFGFRTGHDRSRGGNEG